MCKDYKILNSKLLLLHVRWRTNYFEVIKGYLGFTTSEDMVPYMGLRRLRWGDSSSHTDPGMFGSTSS